MPRNVKIKFFGFNVEGLGDFVYIFLRSNQVNVEVMCFVAAGDWQF